MMTDLQHRISIAQRFWSEEVARLQESGLGLLEEAHSGEKRQRKQFISE